MPDRGDLDRRVSLERIVVVGASLAGLRAVETLRREGYEGALVLIGAEEHQPYDRPPLSKQLLRGEWDAGKIALRKQGVDELKLDLRLGRRAVRLDTGAREVELDDGARVSYDGLIIATGAAPRTLPGTQDLDGVYVLRTLDDALALRAAFEKNPRVCVVGAGFIGAEVAASARECDLQVTMVEPLAAPCVRGLGLEMGQVLAELHREHGVDLRLGIGVDAIEGVGRAERVRLSDGSVLEADVVVVGIGVVPETRWLADSGLELDDGIVCDASCAAGPPGVFAAGDVCRWQNQLFGEVMRVEHWTNAVEQGVHVAKQLLAKEGEPEPFSPVPLFWSDQYDCRIQFAGHSQPDDEVVVAKGDLAERRFVALYGRDGRLTGTLAFNRARDLIAYRRLLAEGISWDDALAHAREAD